MSFIKSNALTLLEHSKSLFNAHPTSRTIYSYGVDVDGLIGYTENSEEVRTYLESNNISYTIVEEMPETLNSKIEINGKMYDKKNLIGWTLYTKKESRNLNTAMDVYAISYMPNTIISIGVRFQDWAFWNTMTDEQAFTKLKEHILSSTSLTFSASKLT